MCLLPSEQTEAEWAWAAGLFEGEGSFVVTKTGRLRLSLKLTDEDVLLRYRQIVGGTVTGPYLYPIQTDGCIRKPAWSWHTNTFDSVGPIIERFRPWLGERRLARLDELCTEWFTTKRR